MIPNTETAVRCECVNAMTQKRTNPIIASFLVVALRTIPGISIRARDPDSGMYGTSGIRYTALRGPLAGELDLDPKTGAITVSNRSKNVFDRESSEFHYLTVEARDDGGRGNRCVH